MMYCRMENEMMIFTIYIAGAIVLMTMLCIAGCIMCLKDNNA